MLGEATFLPCALPSEIWEYHGQDNQVGRASDMKYTVILQREGDGGYVATVPALSGCVSRGDTRAEVRKNIEEAIEPYLEDVRDGRANSRRGEPRVRRSNHFLAMTKIPTDLSGRVLVRMLEKVGFVLKRQHRSHITTTPVFLLVLHCR